ncbi:SMODS domain-containing nucleotidyltransferase [Noviherbaspirillum aridicola]|nr:nucleotidyltransferase [Noviherbaspirillum aridicola]
MATKQQFLDFLYEIEPSTSTVSACSSAHTNLRDKLSAHETFKEVHVSTFLSGSYVRKTAIRPQTRDGELRRPDVDIIVITSHTTADSPETVIDQLYNALSDGGYKNLRKNRRSVSVLLATVDMDVVPIIEAPDGEAHLIPDKELNEWLRTNPRGHTQWATDVNKEAGERFKPMVKLLKWWRREHLADLKRPKGFILEALVAKHMSYSETSYEELFAKLLRTIKSEYALTVALHQVPYIEDPAVAGNNVFSNVEPEEFKQFYDMICKHVGLIADAQAETDGAKQLAKWREIFGTFFPAAGTAAKAANENLLRPAAAAGLSFPAKPIIPNKPQGFA